MAAEVGEALRVEAPTAVVAILKDLGAPPAARVSAARCILDHAIGKPLQAVAIADETPTEPDDMTTEQLLAYLRACAPRT